MKDKTTIKFDSSQRIYFEVKSGINTPTFRQTLHISATEDPFFENESSFGDLLDLAIKGNTVFNGTIRSEDRKYLLDGFNALQKIIYEKKKQVEAIPAFGEVKQIKFKP
uniref:Uncharacterized protein n=1 Tax=Curvibacter symbiont subsp. Hydra magnipapillata TaxID=667019 RepID=C9Y6R6_CURXX|nr:hypothetical protein Csp_E36430 [Curvibacter putative symbiont of Hydra magnipapillata]